MTDKYMPQDGEQVEVVLRGKAVLCRSDDEGMNLMSNGEYHWIDFNSSMFVSVAKLSEPEPEWQHGDIIQIREIAGFWTYCFSASWRSSLEGCLPVGPDYISTAWQEGRVRRVKMVPA